MNVLCQLNMGTSVYDPDTGNLLFESTTDKTVKIASNMLLYGARFPTILEGTSRNKSMAAMKIWGQALSNLQINPKYNFAYTIITYNEFKESKVSEEELEGVAEFLSTLYGVSGLMFLREEKPGFIKGSLRTSRSDVDISQLAKRLGGGGHVRTSGFKLAGNLLKTNTGWQII